jgi:DNA-binding SARP family transcriptional activator/Tfp pilus assembly protein PilF
VRVRVLGPLEIVDAAGHPMALGPPKQRTLLALLLVRAGTVVPDEVLIDELWHDPPASALTNLRAYAANLRRVLELAGAVVAVTKAGSGYRVSISAPEFDLERWRTRAAAGSAALAEGDLEGAAGHLREALVLWRGPALADVAVGSALAAWRDSIHEERLAATEDAIEATLRLGHLNLATQRARDLLAAAPMRERAADLLMRARYASGDVAGALAVYDRVRRALVDTLGIEPGDELRELQRGVLRRDLEPLARRTPPAAVPRADATLPRQLPADVPGFVGRTAALDQLDGLLTTGREERPRTAVVISAIAGTAGVGKTALAIHWAHRVASQFPDGQVYINLRGFDPGDTAMSASEAVRVLLETLGVAPQRVPATLDARVGLYRSLLDGRRILIVLDNARDAEQVRPLLPGTSGCLVVVTSRRQLSSLVTIGAQPLTVDLLTEEEARDMLVRRVGPDRVTAEPQAVEEIIRLCARLPMALAIVAARAATHPSFHLADLAGQLREARSRLDGFDDGDPISMRTVFSWSYRTLSEPAARLFRLLGLQPGLDIAASGAASLAGQPVRQVRSALTELAHAHLLNEHVPGRFAFHDLLRAYAAELAEDVDPQPEQQTARRRILDHYLHTAYACDRLLRPDRERIDVDLPVPGVVPEKAVDHRQALAWFTAEHPVLIAAIQYASDHGLDRHAWQLAWTIENVLDWRGQWHELDTTQRLGLTAAQRSADLTGQAHVHRGVARAYVRTGRHNEAATHLEAALDLFGTLGDDAGRAAVHRSLGVVRIRQGRYDAALRHDEQALDLHRATGDVTGQAVTLNNLGFHHAQFGDLHAALGFCRQALRLSQEIGDRNTEGRAWASLGSVHQRLGQQTDAISCHRRAVKLLRDIGDRTAEAESLADLGDAYAAVADHGMSRILWREALDLLSELGHPDAEKIRSRLNAP